MTFFLSMIYERRYEEIDILEASHSFPVVFSQMDGGNGKQKIPPAHICRFHR